ncbi:MAG TPA: hypothetical protein VLQ80_33025 [Candidatus Saccharimonadia bacterium]|nr:hypothetical protein [Candidatus Saccharimonadia bacterium]
MADEQEDRLRQHEKMLQGLARMWSAQHEMNQRRDVLNARLTLAIERIDQTLAHVEIPQARMETLLARLLPQTENGRDV